MSHHEDALIQTPFGFTEQPEWIAQERTVATRAIQHCTAHRAPRCACWEGSRAHLFAWARLYGTDAPEAYLAAELLGELELLEKLPSRVRMHGR